MPAARQAQKADSSISNALGRLGRKTGVIGHRRSIRQIAEAVHLSEVTGRVRVTAESADTLVITGANHEVVLLATTRHLEGVTSHARLGRPSLLPRHRTSRESFGGRLRTEGRGLHSEPEIVVA